MVNSQRGAKRRVSYNHSYYSTIAPFYHIRAKERAKYATLLHCRTGQKYGLEAERQNGRTKPYFISGIINPLFDCLYYHIIRADILLIARILLRNSQNIRAYYMINHRIRCMYPTRANGIIVLLNSSLV